MLPVRDACWAYSEWLDLIRRRFGKKGVLVYSPGAGRASALISRRERCHTGGCHRAWGCAGSPARWYPGAASGA